MNAGYRNAMPAFLSAPVGGVNNSASGALDGYLMAYDQNGNMVYFTVTYVNYWTIKVDGRVVDTVKDSADSTVLTGTQTALSGAGTGYVTGTTSYTAYDAPDVKSVTAPVVITTGYAKLPASLPITVNTNDSLTFKGYETVGGNNVFKAANGLTAEYTTGSGNSATGDQAITLTLTGGAGAVINNATQTIAEAAYEAAGNKLTWSINTSNMTSDITNASVTVASAPQQRTITYSAVSALNGVSAVLSGPQYAMDGESVTVLVTFSGSASADTKLAISGAAGGSWSFSSPMMSLDTGSLKIAQGANCAGLTAEYTFTVSSSTSTVGGTFS